MDYIYRCLINSQAWVSLNFTFFCWFFQQYNQWNAPNLLFIAFFATLMSYNLAHWVTHKHEKWRLFVMIGSVFPLIYLALQLNLITFLVLAILGAISVLYSIPIKRKKLRNLSGTKIYWIAMVWSIGIVLPWFENMEKDISTILVQILIAFCFIVAITIPFDIRDMESDEKYLDTIPQKIGRTNSLITSYILLIVSCVLFAYLNNFILNSFTISYLVVTIIAMILISFVNRNSSKWLTAFWIEGLSGLFWLIYFIL